MSSLAGKRQKGRLNRAISVTLAALMVVGYPGGIVNAGGPEQGTGALSLTTDPSGAAVYVDGRPEGTTPLDLGAVSAGDHRVRVVKDGYLENSRVVSVRPGETQAVKVKLTRNEAISPTQVEDQPEEKKGGGGKKWALIGLGAAAVGAGAYFILSKNSPPVAGTISVSPSGGAGMAGVTSFSISSQGASDPDGDPLTFTWAFGDGTTATGATVTKIYSSPGTYAISLTVSDGDHTVTAPASSIVVARSMAGVWSGASVPGFSNTQVSFNLTQNGTSLGGSMTFAGNISGTVTGVTGNVSALTYPCTATFQSTYTVAGFPGSFTTRFTGTTDANGTTITGTITTTSTALQPPSFSLPATFRR